MVCYYSLMKKAQSKLNIAEKIKTIKKEKHISQAQLVEKVNVHVTHISKIETESYTPSVELLKKIADALEVTTDFLIYDKAESVNPMNLYDTSLYKKMKLIDSMANNDKETILNIIDAFTIKKQMWSVLKK